MSDNRLRYFLPAIPPTSMVRLLLDRAEALESSIAAKFREAREKGTVANVKQLSTTLRSVKAQLAAVKANGGEAEPGTCAICSSDSFLTAKWWRGRTICGRCWPKVGDRRQT